MIKILIADVNEERANKFAREFNKSDASASAANPLKSSLWRYIKRHEPDILMLIHSFGEKKALSYINQAKKHGLSIFSVIPDQSKCPRLVEALSDYVVPLRDVKALKGAFVNYIEEKAVILQQKSSTSKGYRFGLIFADTEKGFVTYKKNRIHFTPMEYQIMCLLVMQKGKLTEKNYILKEIWGSTNLTSRSLSTHIQNIRKKLQKVTGGKYKVETVRGKGYRLVERND